MKKAIIRILACFIPHTKIRRRFRTKMLEWFVDKPESLKKYKKIKCRWNAINNGEKLLPGRFCEYDLVFAIGATCPMTWELIMHKLRAFANPFDWTGGMPPSNWMTEANIWRDTRFITKIKFLCSDFAGFFNQQDMKMICNDGREPHHFVCNTRTKIRFMHLFPVDKSIEGAWDDVATKIKRRCDRLIKELGSSRRVLICWSHRIAGHKDWLDATVSDTDVKKAVKMLNRKFPNTNIDLVFFEHDGTKKEFEYDKIMVINGAYRIRSNHYAVSDAYKAVCTSLSFIGINFAESIVVAEALDNIKLTTK